MAKCCMVGEYGNWCDSIYEKNDIYKKENNKFCLFHAPLDAKSHATHEEKKDLPSGVFNDKIFKYMEEQKLNPKIDLRGSVFVDGISFSERFNEPCINVIDFSKAYFNGNVKFDKIIFEKKVLFLGTIFNGEASFKSTHFKSFVDFGFYKEKIVDNLTQFKNKATFQWARFYEETFFDHVIFGNSKEGVCEYETDFSQVNIEKKVEFEDVNIEMMILKDTDLRKVDFIRCKENNLFLRDMFYDEYKMYTDKKIKLWIQPFKQLFYWWKSDFKYENLIKTEVLYRKFKQKHKDDHNWAEASKFHYNEKVMVMRRYRNKLKFGKGEDSNKKNDESKVDRFFKWIVYSGKYLFLWLYWLFSGFNERPLRAFSMLAIIVCLFSFAFFPSDELLQSSRWESILLTLDFLPIITVVKIEDIVGKIGNNICMKTLIALFQILIAVQLALLLMSIRNKLRR